MAWIPPRTWVDGEAVTASKLNEISESLNYLKEPTDVVFRNTSATNGLLRIARLSRRVSIPPQNDVGGFIEFRADTTATSDVVAAKIEWTWANVNHAQREGRMNFVLADANGISVPLRLGAAGGQPRLGFYGATPAARPVVTGTRDENNALASLLNGLESLGLITNQTTTSTMENVLKANATYGWTAGTLSSSTTGNWVDVVAGITATATGNPYATSLPNGKRAVQFNGVQWFRTAAFPTSLAQPTAIVAVSRRTGDVATLRAIHDSRSSPSSHLLRHNSSMGLQMFAGSSVIASNASTTSLMVTVATLNTVSSSLRINGVQVASGNAGNSNLPGVTIGALFDNTSPFIGQIAMIAVVNGANYAARAAAIEEHALSYYGIMI